MKFMALIINNFDDSIEIEEIEARNGEKAYEKADETRHNQEFYLLFNEERWSNLRKATQLIKK